MCGTRLLPGTGNGTAHGGGRAGRLADGGGRFGKDMATVVFHVVPKVES
jgi:hypothetical protein